MTADRPPPDRPRRRLRWISVGEFVALAGLTISALALYNGWNGGHHATEAAPAAAPAAPLLLAGTADSGGDRIMLTPRVPLDATVQTQTITFPHAVGVAPVDNTGTAEIDASTFARGLLKARHAAGRPGETERQERLPVLIATRYAVDDAIRNDVAIYDVAFTVDSSFLSGAHVRLHGVSLLRRGLATGGQQAIDALWAKRFPVSAKSGS